MKPQEKTVEIKEVDSCGWDEVWAEWFTCPNCKEKEVIAVWDKYCSNCGVKISFDKDFLLKRKSSY